MGIFTTHFKRFSYLILCCFLCCLTALAKFYPVDFEKLIIAVETVAIKPKITFAFEPQSIAAGVPPEAVDVKNFYLQNINEPFQILPLIGKDSDGSIVSFKIISRTPSNPQGRLMLSNSQVSDGQVLTLAEAKLLKFEPRTGFVGTASFTYTVIDNEGLVDASPATFTIPVTDNTSLLVCSGTGLGTNILGASGTFSGPYISPNTGVNNCINNGSSTAGPLNNLGSAKPSQTTYTYASTSGGLGPEGTYSFLKTLGTISATDRNCIKKDWVASDHTGDGGYAMIVNGSPNQATFGKTFYQATSIAVCPNTLYEFSAYVINVLPGNHSAAAAGSEPNISFYINGQLVSTSGPIQYSTAATNYVPQWVKVGGLWYSGPNTTQVDLRIDNATFVAGGNDLGLDDISMAICGPDITYPNIDLTARFCSYGVLPLKADVKASINTYSAYIFQNSTDGGGTWTDMGIPKIGSPVYNSGLNTYEYLAEYGDIPITPSMDGYRYRLKVATDINNLTGTTCNISADKIITVSTFNFPSAGPDITGCNPATTAKLAAAGAGETWSAVAGNPIMAAIDQAGNISGMTVNGIYKFRLTNTVGCSDTVNVTRDQVKSAGADATVCAPATALKLDDAGTGYKWEVVPGNPAAANINSATGAVTGLTTDGVYHFILRSDYGGCTDEVLITKSSIGLTDVKTDILCSGASTGTINLSVTGGTVPYTFLWSNGQTTEDATGLAAGNYTVTVTDANGCTQTAAVTITEPSAIVATVVASPATCNGSATGSANLSVSGGTGVYTFLWSNGQTTEDATGLAAGNYSVQITDANGCTQTANVTITEPTVITASITGTAATCNGSATGSANLTVSGGTGVYTFLWSNGQTTEDATGLAAGIYSVQITDANGCTQTANVTITEPSAIVVTVVASPATCNGSATGSANLTVSGGTGVYSFLWSNGQTTEDATGLAAGNYTVTVTDANGCTQTANVTITEPTVITASITGTVATCNGSATGSANLTVSGGTVPYTFLWSNGQTTEDATGLAAGNYTVIVTDANGCITTGRITIAQPEDLKVEVTKSDVSCAGANTGSASTSVIGGTAPYSFKWSSGQTTKDISSVPSGTYTVLVIDARNCTATGTITITQAKALNLSLAVENAGCLNNNGQIVTSITGGVKPYSLSWTTKTGLTGKEFSNLKPGIYEVLVTDAVGCVITAQAEVLTTSCTPVAQNDFFAIEQDKTLTNDVSLNDTYTGSDPVNFRKLTDPTNGTISFESDGKFIFTPDKGFAGSTEFTYQICNATGQCHTAIARISVNSFTIVNLTPELSSVREGGKVAITARLLRAFKEDVTITIEYSGKAQRERDYLVLDQYLHLKIPKGSLSTTEKVTIAAVNDGFEEGDEDIILKIKTTSHADVHIGTGSVVIITDVYPPPPPTDIPQDEPLNPDIVPDPLMSPNGDGNGNEFFNIKNIESFPDNEVLIFNRWGNELFAIKNYNNNDRSFKGFANKGILVNADLPLSDGVYFYIVYTYHLEGTLRVKRINKGYLILKR